MGGSKPEKSPNVILSGKKKKKKDSKPEKNPNVILEEEIDENYEPSQKDIEEYAEWLGMNLEEDRDLFWIARQGLKEPLPKSWKPCQSGEGEIFYFNFDTGSSEWEHPCDEQYRGLYKREKAKRDNEESSL